MLMTIAVDLECNLQASQQWLDFKMPTIQSDIVNHLTVEYRAAFYNFLSNQLMTDTYLLTRHTQTETALTHGAARTVSFLQLFTRVKHTSTRYVAPGRAAWVYSINFKLPI
jgi:hypothetical protein